MTQTYWAITGMGWGRGDTPQKAMANYRSAQRRNWPKLTEADLDEAWGFVWLAPEGAAGFTHDSKLWWTFEDGPAVEAEQDQKVHTIGAVPMAVLR